MYCHVIILTSHQLLVLPLSQKLHNYTFLYYELNSVNTLMLQFYDWLKFQNGTGPIRMPPYPNTSMHKSSLTAHPKDGTGHCDQRVSVGDAVQMEHIHSPLISVITKELDHFKFICQRYSKSTRRIQ